MSEDYEVNSENEDDPEVYESSGDEWEDAKDNKKKRGSNTRASKRLSKKPRVSHQEDSEEEGAAAKKKSKNGVSKKKPEVEQPEEDDEEEVDEEQEDEEEEENEDEEDSNDSPSGKNALKRVAVGSKIGGSDYVNGGFLILKRDAQGGEAKKPCLWRIDGKALLQKYEAFEEDGGVKHRNTSIYTGWSSLDKDLYHPVTVKVLQHLGQNMTVELNWEKLKDVKDEDE